MIRIFFHKSTTICLFFWNTQNISVLVYNIQYIYIIKKILKKVDRKNILILLLHFIDV